MPEKGEFITNIMPDRKVSDYAPPIPRRRFESIDGGRKDEETPKQARERYQKKRKIAAWSSLTALGVGGATMGGLEIADQSGSQHSAVIGWQGFKEGVKQIGGKILYSLGFNKEGKEVYADLGEETPLSTQISTEAELTTEESTLTVEQEADPENVNPVAAGEIGPVGDEGVTIPAIEGLKYDAKTNTFFAVEGNPYGLEAETKVGVFVKDAFEFNGQMENSIGLKPEVIEFWQNKVLLESKELRFPFFIDLSKSEGVRVELLENELANEAENLDGLRAENFTLLAIDAPKDTIIYSPLKTNVSGELTGFYIFNKDDESDYYEAGVVIPEDLRTKILYKDQERIDWASINFIIRKSEVVIPTLIEYGNRSHSETEIGTPLFKIIDSLSNDEEQPVNDNLDQVFHGKFLLDFRYELTQATYDDEAKRYVAAMLLETGKDIFLEINKIKVFIISADV